MSIIPAEQILSQINRARTKPLEYAAIVQKQIDSFVDDWSMPLTPGCNYKTNEGKGVWLETLAFLKSQKPIHEFKLAEGLRLAADDHAEDLAANGLFGHVSSNGDDMTCRIKYRCGPTVGSWGQNVGSSFDLEGRDHAMQTVIGLIIDDGVKSRGHRKAIYSQTFKYIGSSSRVSNQKVITVINFHSDKVKAVNTGKKVMGKGNSENMSKGEGKGKKVVNVLQSKDINSAKKDVQKINKTEKKVISSSTSTKTKTVNGKTTKTVVKKLKYADGTEEEMIEQTSS